MSLGQIEETVKTLDRRSRAEAHMHGGRHCAPWAEAAGFTPGVWKWKDDERAQLRAELDAAYFPPLPPSRDDVQYVLGNLPGNRQRRHPRPAAKEIPAG